MVNYDNNVEIKYIFEFEFKPVKGTGKSSYTDLMIEYPNTCIAIEAKRTESAYETVINWLGNSDNRKDVLDGWLQTICGYTDIEVNPASISDLPYQLIHRVASACSLKKSKTHIIYLGFDLNEARKLYYSDKLTKFSKILGNKIDFHLACFKIDDSKERKRLEAKWNNKERDLSKDVIRCLMDNSLMTLSQESVKKLNEYI